jgi:hypothetical protein
MPVEQNLKCCENEYAQDYVRDIGCNESLYVLQRGEKPKVLIGLYFMPTSPYLGGNIQLQILRFMVGFTSYLLPF